MEGTRRSFPERMANELIFPIFPLEAVALIPGAVLPLHIFEPRYRAMVHDALDGARLIAMAMPSEGHASSDEPRPPVHPVVQLGRIVDHRAYDDGRADVALAGVARMRIAEELLVATPYRVVRAVPLPDRADVDAADVATALQLLLARIDGLSDGDLDALRTVEPGRAADALVLRLPVSARDKHRVVAATDPLDRIDAIHGILDALSGRTYPLHVRRGDPRLN